MDTENGSLYQDVGYINNYIGIHFEKEDSSDTSYIISISPSDLETIAKVEAELQILDTRYDFTSKTLGRMNRGFSLEEAVTEVKKDMLEEEQLYEYAKEEELACTEEDVDAYIKRQLSYHVFRNPETDKTYDYESIYEEYGTTYGECLEKQRELIKKRLTVDNLYQEKYKEFETGNDTLNGKSYWTVSEYYQAYLDEVVYPEMEKKDFSDYLKELDSAEIYFRDRFDR